VKRVGLVKWDKVKGHAGLALLRSISSMKIWHILLCFEREKIQNLPPLYATLYARFFSFPIEVPRMLVAQSPLFKPLLSCTSREVGVSSLGTLAKQWECLYDLSRGGVKLSRHEVHLFRYMRANWALASAMLRFARDVMSSPPSGDNDDFRSLPYVEEWLCSMVQKVGLDVVGG
jgi:hypothetical protein